MREVSFSLYRENTEENSFEDFPHSMSSAKAHRLIYWIFMKVNRFIPQLDVDSFHMLGKGAQINHTIKN